MINPGGQPAASQEIKILLVEDDPEDAEIVARSLLEGWGLRTNLMRAENLKDAIRFLHEKPIDVMLLDLTLPDADGLSTFLQARKETADTPIVVLTGLDDQQLATQAVEHGAQDYLVKQDVNGSTLIRSIRYAQHRQHLLNELRALSLTDELTGLTNRRGFMFLAQQELNAVGRRAEDSLILLLVDLDNMKQINDQYGHKEGDLALIDFSGLLRKTFRSSDVLGRIGGDEFAILAVHHQDENPSIVIERLRKAAEEHKKLADRPYELQFSVGIIRHDPKHPTNIHEILHRADVLMYEEKKAKKNGTK